MQFHTIASEEDEQLWQKIIAMEEQPFTTARGLEFSYQVKRNRNGERLGEIIFDRKEKTVTRNTILLAYKKAIEVQTAEGCVSGPKKLGVFGASYLYPIFLHMGICSKEPQPKTE
ncbi:MAG: hypothetical protein II885_17790 [Oscillospiraceae bacterium]|nr:hypothetical protein [Oscillospiraceae bacterium]MBQ3704581.1 hypothetical protein [Oscillospiraceae bacterium]